MNISPARVLPYNPDAWVDEGKTKIGYENSLYPYIL